MIVHLYLIQVVYLVIELVAGLLAHVLTLVLCHHLLAFVLVILMEHLLLVHILRRLDRCVEASCSNVQWLAFVWSLLLWLSYFRSWSFFDRSWLCLGLSLLCNLGDRLDSLKWLHQGCLACHQRVQALHLTKLLWEHKMLESCVLSSWSNTQNTLLSIEPIEVWLHQWVFE